MRETLRIVCEFTGAVTLSAMALSLVWFAVAMAVAAAGDFIRRHRRTYVPREWVDDEVAARRNCHQHNHHPSRWNGH